MFDDLLWRRRARSSGSATSVLLSLHRDGMHIRTSDGQKYKGLHIGGFRLPQHFVENRLAEANRWADWAQGDCHMTGNRSLAFHCLGRDDDYDPRRYGLTAYYAAFDAYLDWATARAWRQEINIFAGAVGANVFPDFPKGDPFQNDDDVMEHAERIVAIVKKYPGHYIQIWNEGEDNNGLPFINRFPAAMFAGVMTGRTRIYPTETDWIGFPVPVDNQLDVVFFHNERRDSPFDTTRKTREGEQYQHALNKPVIFSEPERVGNPGLRWARPDLEVYTNQQRQNVYSGQVFVDITTVHGTYESGIQRAVVPTSAELLESCREAGKAQISDVFDPEGTAWNYHADEDCPAAQFRLRYPKSEDEARAHGWTPAHPFGWGDFTSDPTGCKHFYSMVSPDGKRCNLAVLEAGPEFNLRERWKVVRQDPGYAYYLEAA